MTAVVAPGSERTLAAVSARTVPAAVLTALLFASFTLDNVLLLRFLGYGTPFVSVLAIALPFALGYLAWRAIQHGPRIDLRAMLACFAIAAVLLLLGGEGRLFFATDDWQIRDAVLADMATHSWPFDYWLGEKSQLLRAPVGMYLVPALLGSASQAARDWALFAHNCFILGTIFSLGAILFEGRRARLIALVIFVMFSGLDVVGDAIERWATGAADWEHLERWANNHQFSSHVTQLFWVPQHAFASWICTLFYLFWRRGLAPVGLFAAAIPLVALWSPFAIFGALPFALFAGLRILLTGRWQWQDVAFAAVAVAIALPALLYLRADAATVGSGLRPPPAVLYALILLIEIVPFLWPLLRDRSGATDQATIAIVAISLCLVPAWAVGPASDFQMRASIMALALLALAVADWAIRLQDIPMRLYLLAVVSVGSVTGAAELYRVFVVAPSPSPLCSVAGVWMQQTNTIVPYASYFASREAFPSVLAPVAPVDRAGTRDPAHCWARTWREPS